MLKLSPSPQPPFSRSGLELEHLPPAALETTSWEALLQTCTPLPLRVDNYQVELHAGPPVTSFRGLCTVTHEQALGSVGFNTEEGLLVLEKLVRWTVCESWNSNTVTPATGIVVSGARRKPIYRQTSEILWIRFQTATSSEYGDAVSQTHLWFPSASNSYVYATL